MFKILRSKALGTIGSLALLLVASSITAQAGPGYDLGFASWLNNNVSVPHNTALNAYPITLTAWVLTSQVDSAYRGIVQKTSNNPTNGYALVVRNGYLFGAYARSLTSSVLDGTNALAGGYVADGNWHHVALVVDASGGYLFLDGILQTSHGWNGTPQSCTPSTSLVFGRYAGNTLTCSLDEVTLWNMAKTEGEIQAMMHQPLAGSESGLVGYWRLDEGTGTTTANLSSYGALFNGNLNSSPTWNVSSAPIGLPVVTTLGATDVTASSATLNGSVLPNYQSTTAFFQYGQTVAYGSTSASTVVDTSNASAVPVAQAIGGLETGRSYYYRLVAVNSAGTSYGDNGIFMIPPSTDAALNTLMLSAHNIAPAFNKDVLNYTCSVEYGAGNERVFVTASEPHATIQVRVNGGTFASVTSGNWSPWLPLNVGSNPIDIRVTAQDGTTVRTYTVTVTRPPSTNANLTNLVLSHGPLAPGFSPAITTYSASVANGVTSVTVTPTAAEATATIRVRVNYDAYAPVTSGTASPSLPLSIGNNIIDVQVTAQDGTTVRTYTVTVNRAPSSNASLSGLVLSSGTLAPAFSSGGLSYSASVANGVTSVTVTPTAAEVSATIRVRVNNGAYAIVASGAASAALALNVGNNPVDVQVTAQDGTTVRTYTVTVNRAPSSNAALASLTISAGTLSPVFAAATTNYLVEVANNVSAVSVTPTVADNTASVFVQINGGTYTGVVSGNSSSSLGLAIGTNYLDIRVEAQDGTTVRTYTVTVNRAPSSNTALAALALSAGTLSPVFAAGTTNYTATLPFTINALTVSATAADPSATIQVRVNGGAYSSVIPGNPSAWQSLAPGINTLEIRVTAQDGISVRTYTVAVNRQVSSNANLWMLSTSAGPLSPAFDSQVTNYNVSVNGSVTSVTVTPAAADESSWLHVRINGGSYNPVVSSQASSPLDLVVGTNTIEIRVTAQDTVTVRTYTVLVNRIPYANADLSFLGLTGGTLSPTFAPDITNYTVSFPSTVRSASTVATAAGFGAGIQVRFNGGPYAAHTNAPFYLPAGTNRLDCLVTAQDGVTVKVYTVEVYRAPSSEASLDWLQFGSATGTKYVSPVFTPATTNYSCAVSPATDWVQVRATAKDTNAALRLFRNGVDFGALISDVLGPFTGLVVGDNLISVRVTAEDGTVRTYEVNVHRLSDNVRLSSLVVSEGTLKPPFNKLTLRYTMTLPHSVSNLVFTPTADHPGASISLGFFAQGYKPVPSGQPSDPYPMAVGLNMIGIQVRAEDGVSLGFYDLDITRQPSTNARLAGLVLSQGTLAPAFSPVSAEYTAVLPADTAGLVVTPTAEETNATIRVRVNGGAFYTNQSGAASAELPMRPGVNTVEFKVTAQDGTNSMFYSLLVARQASPYVTTLPATRVHSAGTATLNQMVTPNGLPTLAWFEYGADGQPPARTAAQAIAAGAELVFVTSPISGFDARRPCYLRGVASNSLGVAYGNEQVFGSSGRPRVWASSAFYTNVPPGLGNLTAVAAGGYHAITLGEDGRMRGWGDAYDHVTNAPPEATNLVAVGASGVYWNGRSYNLALREDHTVVAWGSNYASHLNPPPGLTNVVAISAGPNQAMALKADGHLAAWGSWYPVVTNVPPGLRNLVGVAAGNLALFALKDDGTVLAWGGNYYGITNVPAGLSNVVSVAAGTDFAVALRRDGTVVAWGRNEDGQTNVPPGLTNVIAIDAGLYHTVALTRDGRLVGWGKESAGEITLAGSSNLVVTAVAAAEYATVCLAMDPAPERPVFTSISQPAPGMLRVSATGSPGAAYQVWATTNLADWTLLGPAAETAPGIFEFTDSAVTNYSKRFYQLRWAQP